MVCSRLIPYHKTGLAEVEALLRENHEEAKSYGEGWTKNVRDDWACPGCLAAGKALKAEPLEQNFRGYSGPRFAYVDQAKRCQRCDVEFVFTASEQKVWYETRKFHPKSKPLNCLDCGKKLRRFKVANRKLGEALQNLDSKDWKELKRVGELYREIGVADQARLYFRRAKNRCEDDPQALAEILTLLKSRLKPSGPNS